MENAKGRIVNIPIANAWDELVNQIMQTVPDVFISVFNCILFQELLTEANDKTTIKIGDGTKNDPDKCAI